MDGRSKPWLTWAGEGTHQDQGRVIESVAAVDVDAFLKFLLALLKIAATASFAEGLEAFALVEGIVFLELARRDGDVFFVEGFLDFVLLKHHDIGSRKGRNDAAVEDEENVK